MIQECIQMTSSGQATDYVQIATEDARLLAERLRLLCSEAGVPVPRGDDAHICAIGGMLIGNALLSLSKSADSKPAPVTCPADAIVALYHEAMPDNPRVKVLNEARRTAIRKRWREAAKLTCKPFGYSNRPDGLAAWKAFFEVCAESDFLTGKVPALPGRPVFIADIDFIMSPSGFAKILENKYHREQA